MTRSPLAFTGRVLRSHLGHVLLAVSWSFILFNWLPRPYWHPELVDCVRAAYEDYFIPEVLRVVPIWTFVIGVAHFPAMLVTKGVTKLFQIVFALSCGPTAKVELALFFLFSAIQWLLVGYIIESLFRWWRSRA